MKTTLSINLTNLLQRGVLLCALIFYLASNINGHYFAQRIEV